MAMHQGFDLSRFKKVSSDDKATTMRHANGHEVKIVHSALSPKMREQIEALPMHEAAVPKMARGGEVKRYPAGGEVTTDPQAMDPASPEPVDDAPPGADMTAANAASRPPGIPPPPARDDETADDVSPENTIDVIGKRPPPTAQQLDADDAAWEHDLVNGHITPETYQGMFEKKDTLGKIGTLFGLMVGGAGSGLAHQPNMAMEMMNRTIQNDLQAQTANKHNANSYYNTAMNMLKGSADIEYVNSQTALNKLPLVAAQDLADKVAKMPPGPLQAQAAAAVQHILRAIRTTNAARNQQTEQGLLQRHVARSAGKPKAYANGVNDDAVRLATIAKMPGVDPGQLNSEVGAVKTNRQGWSNYLDSTKRLDNMAGAGQVGQLAGTGASLLSTAISLIDPATGAIAAGAKGPAADLANNFTQERNAIIAKNPQMAPFLPSLFDFGDDQTLRTKLDSAASVFGQNEAPVTQLRRVPGAYAPPNFGTEVEHFFKTRTKSKRSTEKPKKKDPGAAPPPSVAAPLPFDAPMVNAQPPGMPSR